MNNDLLKKTLKKYWGYDAFRPLQESIITSVLNAKDTIALLSTGGGKSLCYQLPAIILDGKTIVITPLIALMEDQVSNLKKRGINAKAIHSGISHRHIDRILDNFVFGTVKLLFISPERIESPAFAERMKKAKVDLIAVDESHCISQWGYDFRPSYFNIISLRKLFPKAPYIALTATATPVVLDDIIDKLGMRSPNIYQSGYERRNLSISIIKTENKEKQLFTLVTKLRGSGIIYLRNRKQVEYIFRRLKDKGHTVGFYHGGLNYEKRKIQQERWMNGESRIIISTNAFGMGIDKADVRFVIHLDIPPSLEEYYQEIGRAGRDGLPSYVISVIRQSDFVDAQYSFDVNYPDIDEIHDIYHRIFKYLDIAVGGGKDEIYDFNIIDFCKRFDLKLLKTYNAINILERETFFIMTEGFSVPSTVKILLGQNEISTTLINLPKRKKLVNYILRRYEGLFITDVKINEEVLASELNVDITLLEKQLKALNREGIISYKARKSKSQILFLQDRISSAHFSIDKIKYKTRKNNARERLHAVLAYFNDHTCRQKQILKYFGEEGKMCGRCDICLGSQSDSFTKKEKRQIHDHIKETLSSEGEIPLTTYIDLWPYNKRKRVISCLRFLENEGFIKLKNNNITQA